METGGWAPVPDQARVSTCTVEATLSWRAAQALTPDATQMANWSPAEVHFHCLCSAGPAPPGQVMQRLQGDNIEQVVWLSSTLPAGEVAIQAKINM